MERLLRSSHLRRPIKLVYRRPGRRNAPMPAEALPPEKTQDATSMLKDRQLIKTMLDTVVAPERGMSGEEQQHQHQSRVVFQQLLGTMGALGLPSGETSAALGGDKPPATTVVVRTIDRLLAAFADRTAPILPDVDMLNEALRGYIDCRQVEKARHFVQQMPKLYGVHPNSQTQALLASLALRTGDMAMAADTIRSASKIDAFGLEVCNSIVLSYFKRGQDELAWAFFDDVRAKALPSPLLSATMLMRCGKGGLTEKAFLVYKQLMAQGLTPNAPCSSALIYVASKRKEYFATAIELYRQMDLLKMTIDLPVYNNLLYACGKVADLKTALSLWQKVLLAPEGSALRPNEFTCCNFLWALASVETKDCHLSKRGFVYDMNASAVVEAAQQVYEYVLAKAIPINAHLLSALLAVYSNLGRRAECETIFWKTLLERGLPRTPFAYELMFKLYDNTFDYASAKTVYAQLQKDGVRVPYEGWRALARTAALCGELEAALAHVGEMHKQGYKPHIADFSTVRVKFFERDRKDLVRRLEALCEVPTRESNPLLPWLKRSQAISEMLRSTYGAQAPGSATKVHE